MYELPRYHYKWYGKTVHIYEPVFRNNIWVLISNTHKDYIELHKKRFGIEPNKDIDYKTVSARYSVCTVSKSNQKYDIHIIWLRKNNTPELCHEVIHCVNRVLADRGIRCTDDTDEVFAYYAQYLINTIILAIKNKPKTR